MKDILKKNQIINLDISGYTSEGGGVGHYQGIAVFVAGTAKGDSIKCLIIKAKKNYAIGKVLEILKKSKSRAESDCNVFPSCGGCVFRHIKYENELELKWNRLKDAFFRIAHIEIEPNEIIGAKETERYRNKALFPVRQSGDDISIGFFAQRSHNVINIDDCKLHPKEFSDICKIFYKWMKENNISAYDEKSHSGILRHIYIRKAFATNQIMVCAVVNQKSLIKSKELIHCLTQNIENIKSIVVNYNTEKTNVALGKKYDVIWGDEYIIDKLCGIKVCLSPLSFYQINKAQAEVLYKKVADLANLKGKETLIDLYCGAGTIGLSMAKNAKKLIGIELVPDAIKDAKKNAEINNIKNSEFICADAAKAAIMLKERNINPDIVVLDPPRKGCSPELLNTISEMNPKTIIYVSCDPATLARDTAILKTKNYEIKELTPVDLFPKTAHVETVVLMSRVKVHTMF